MNVFTLGFTKKTANIFFDLIRNNNIKILLDIRLNNKSQLAGYTKGDDLSFFLMEICKCEYRHYILAAPTKDLLNNYKKEVITWNQYENEFYKIMKERKAIEKMDKEFNKYENVCLLCSEETPENCHRRLVAELWKSLNDKVIIKHLIR